MTKIETFERFNKYLISIYNAEKSIEYQRQILGNIPQFEPYAVFQRLDRQNKKFITADDLKLFLKENNTRYFPLAVVEFIRQYDKDNDNVLNYEEFLKIVLTVGDNELRAIVTQRENYYVSVSDFLSSEIEIALSYLIKMELNLVEDMLTKSEGVKYSIGFNIREVFKEIDYLDYNFIDEEELALYLRKWGYFLNNFDSKLLLNRLDRNCDGKITFSDFEAVFFPDKMYNQVRTYGTYNHKIKNQAETETSRNNLNTKRNKITNTLQKINQSEHQIQSSPNIKSSLNSYTSSPQAYRGMDLSENSVNNSTQNAENPSGQIIDHDLYSHLYIYLLKLLSIIIKTEKGKETFSLKSETDVNILFTLFDPYKSGHINIFDFKDGLFHFDIFTRLDEIRLVFRTYDLNKDDILSYSEFVQMVLTNSSEHLLHSNHYQGKPSISDYSKNNFADFIRILIDSESQIEKLRKETIHKSGFIISSIFDLLKGRIKNYANREDVLIYQIKYLV